MSRNPDLTLFIHTPPFCGFKRPSRRSRGVKFSSDFFSEGKPGRVPLVETATRIFMDD